jgi:deoxyhypusine synthase
MSKGPISQFIEKHYLHFNSAALVDAAKGYEEQLANGAKMMVTLAVEHEYCRNRKDFCRNDSSRQSADYIMYRCKFRRRHHELGSSFTLKEYQTTMIFRTRMGFIRKRIESSNCTCIPEHAFVVCKSIYKIWKDADKGVFI